MPPGNPNYSKMWPEPKLTEEQRAKCLLLDLTIFQAGDNQPPHQAGKYIIARLQDRSADLYMRPINLHPNWSSHVFVDTIEECFLLAINPEKYGGHWDI